MVHIVKYNACLLDGTSVSKSEGVEFRLADGMDGFFPPLYFIHSDLKTIYVYSDLSVDYLKMFLLNVPGTTVALGLFFFIDELTGFEINVFQVH
ncbi:hypothetical protein E2562_023141 [Oryza meyeriana var. granulata]|uniref:Uncharacterized protein n=1 Tax=Oryza meyeriana var. granulata TaxID=110450 RepID=A0A6G1E0I0_9ORYZ|nr:hypothetical protein E2562_023141 [Oryza meyeriana var. granulata]